MRVLALDIGLKKTGIAISDLERTVISPLKQIRLEKFNGSVFFNLLKKSMFSLWDEIEEVVIGSGLDTEYENDVSKAVEQVVRVLKSWTNWKIILVSEINSSIESREFLRRINCPKNKRNQLVDSYAALFLLKDYFDLIKKNILVSF